MTSNGINLETRIIMSWIKPGTSVLDLGCGEGDLLHRLARENKCRVQGIEIDDKAIHRCVAKGLSVLQGDIDSGLADYGDKSFDYVVLNQSFQQVKKPDTVLQEALRIGREVIVSFPNFAYFPARLQIFFRGRTPITPSLPYEWHDTPNLHFLSIQDFVEYCRSRYIKIVKTAFKGRTRQVRLFPNLLASTGVFRLSKDNGRE
jgi:methionine biosynthesis protein MetW